MSDPKSIPKRYDKFQHAAMMRAARKRKAMRQSTPTYGKRMPVEEMKPGYFVTLDCGCLVKLIRPNDHDWTSTPMLVYDNNNCPMVWDEDPPVQGGDQDLRVYGSWRIGWKGTKQHRSGSQLHDNGAWHGIMHPTANVLKRFRRELEAEADPRCECCMSRNDPCDCAHAEKGPENWD